MTTDANKPSLTRGLDAILKVHEASYDVATGNKEDSQDKLIELPIDTLSAGKFQPRKHFSPNDLDSLTNSIQSQGILQPLIVRATDNQQFEIIAGERRWRAAKRAGLLVVPAIVKQVDDAVAAAFSLVENIQRKDLNALEEALALQRLHDEFNLSHDEIALNVGRSRAAVTNMLRLLTLEESVKQALQEDLISMGHARALVTLDHRVQREICAAIINKHLSVRQTERFVRQMTSQKPAQLNQAPKIQDSQLLQWRDELAKKYQVDLAIRVTADDRYQLVMKAGSREAFEKLILHLNVSIL